MYVCMFVCMYVCIVSCLTATRYRKLKIKSQILSILITHLNKKSQTTSSIKSLYCLNSTYLPNESTLCMSS